MSGASKSKGIAVLVAAAALLGAACSSSAATGTADAGAAAPDEAGSVGCGTQGETYSANLTKTGTAGVYTFTLVQAVPAPPDLNGNVWTFKVTDKTGASPALSQVVVYPFMPLMGHPSDQTPTVTANADGSFTASDVYLFMPGLWTVTISVTEAVDAGASEDAAPHAPAAPITLDSAVFSFCVN